MTTAMWISGGVAIVFWVLAGWTWNDARRSFDFYGFIKLGSELFAAIAAIATVAFLLLVLFR